MAVSKRLRYEILRRDNHTCRYCGATAPDVPLTVDHVTPVALGGTDDPTNLATCCEPCNSGKSATPPDAATVTDVADDAMRWAAAIKQAAQQLSDQEKPKLAYRQVFEEAWNSWTWDSKGKRKTFDLPAAWKTSIETFRQTGLPAEVWPGIVEKAMTNKTVRADNLFRYTCGIAWRMVRELHDTARVIVGQAAVDATDRDHETDLIAEAAIAVWAGERGDRTGGEEEFRASAIEACRDSLADPHRLIAAAQYAAWYGETNLQSALAAFDRYEALQCWELAWLTKAGEYPDEKRTEMIQSQCNAFLEAGVYLQRVIRAAEYAGSHRSAFLHFGLSDAELALTRVSEHSTKTVEIWNAAFEASAGRWPTNEKRQALAGSLKRIGRDGEFGVADVYAAAAAAGTYQDPDLSTCIPRHLSVFEIAAQPLGGEA